MKLKRRKKAMKSKASSKAKVVAKPKKLKRASLATICAEVIRDNPKAGYNLICKKVEAEFKERGILSYVIQNTVNDVMDALNV